jgi:hypothetical protein
LARFSYFFGGKHLWVTSILQHHGIFFRSASQLPLSIARDLKPSDSSQLQVFKSSMCIFHYF